MRAERREIHEGAGDAPQVLPIPGEAMKRVMILCGGEEVEDYDDRYCAVCGRELRHAVTCRKAEGLVCQRHCMRCRHYLSVVQRCTWRDKLTDKNQTDKRKKPAEEAADS